MGGCGVAKLGDWVGGTHGLEEALLANEACHYSRQSGHCRRFASMHAGDVMQPCPICMQKNIWHMHMISIRHMIIGSASDMHATETA